jgi:hypothetical protein
MRLLHRTSSSAGSGAGAGVLDGGALGMRCAVSYEDALGIAREVGVPLGEFMWDAM